MRFPRSPLLLLAAALAPGCDSSVAPPPPVPLGWQTVSAGKAFTFRAPPDLKPVPVQGIDSFVGKYASPTLEVTFDYGSYSDPMDQEGYTSRAVKVDGKDARIVSKGDIVAIHFPEVSEETRLTMSVRLNGGDSNLAETLLQSIDFP